MFKYLLLALFICSSAMAMEDVSIEDATDMTITTTSSLRK